MTEALQYLDRLVAAGVVARAAIAIHDTQNPAARTFINDEEKIRASVLSEARAHLGLARDDFSESSIEQITDYLDGLSENLIEAPDTDAAVKRLIENGTFPSDLYEIHIIKDIADFWGKEFGRESQLIERTIKAPMQEQHFGPPKHHGDPHMISLFSRKFVTPFPHRDFTMLVAGHRGDGSKLIIHQAWRLYGSQVNLAQVADLVELLHRFSDVYGADILVDKQRGHFFLSADKVESRLIEFQVDGKPCQITVTQFAQHDRDTGRQYSSLVVVINLDKYRDTIKKLDTKEIW